MSREAFVLEHTAPASPTLVPEIELRLATEVTPLWAATQDWLDARGVEPPYWAFAWAGGQALARFVLDRPELVRGRRVVDFATGSGLVAIAAAYAGAGSVLALDVDPLAVAAARINAARAGVAMTVVGADRVGDALEDADVLLAGDVFYEAAASARFSAWFRALAGTGKDVVVGDPGRTYVPADLEALATYEVATSLELEGSSVRTTVVARFAAPLGRRGHRLPNIAPYAASSKPTSTSFSPTSTGRFTSLPSRASQPSRSPSLAASTLSLPSAR